VDAEGFILPLVRRLEAAGLRHMEVNSAYSSKLGNLLWGWPLLIPDPACAAVELGRRFLQGDPKSSERMNGGNRRKERTPSAGIARCRGSHGVEAGLESTSPQSGDTPRCTLLALRQRFRKRVQVRVRLRRHNRFVSRLEPARIASDLRIHMRKDL